MTNTNFDFQFSNNFAINSNKKTNRKWFSKKLEDSEKNEDITKNKKQDKNQKKNKKQNNIVLQFSSSENDTDDVLYDSDIEYNEIKIDLLDYDSSPFDLD